METVWFRDEVSTDSVPLCKDYLKDGGSVGDETTVRTVIRNQTGLLLVGDKFKGVVFRNKTVYNQLLEALASYIADPESAGLLVIKALQTGYVLVGATEFGSGGHHWVSEGSNFRLSDKAASDSTDANPFIQKSEAPTGQSSTPRTQKAKGKTE